jgi:putative ABC transport system permease protein
VAPVLVFWNTEKGSEFIFGIDYASFDQICHGFIFRAGRELQGEDEVIIDDVKADAKKLKVGDSFNILNHSFRIAGIVEHGKGSRVFVPLQTLQRLQGSPGRATFMLINCEPATTVAQTVANLKKRLEGYDIRPLGEFVSQMSVAYSSDSALKYFLNIVKSIAITVGIFAIFLAMYTTITERTREIGILKSLGASKKFILWVFMKEALLLCLLGLLTGIAFSYLGVWMVGKWSRSLTILLTWEWTLKAGLIAYWSATLGALYPSLRAAGRDPVDALGYE